MTKNIYPNRKKVTPTNESPFRNDMAATIKLGKKTMAYAGTGDFWDNETGQMITNMAYTGLKKAVDKTTFLKMYSEALMQFFELPRAALNVYKIILQAYLEDNRNYSDTIFMDYVTAQERGYKFNRAYWIRGINYLIEAGFIYPKISRGWYHMNPNRFYKGDRMVMIREFVRDNSMATIMELKDEVNRSAVPSAPKPKSVIQKENT